MRESITSVEIAERFGKFHRNIAIAIRKLLKEDLNSEAFFVKSQYVSKQNKKLDMYVMDFSGFSLLTDTWGFSRGKSAAIKAEIMSEFGESCVVLSSVRTRAEDRFHEMLSEFLYGVKIIRQYAIAGCRVDFYIPEYNVFIEFDEEQHFSSSYRGDDRSRWESIKKFIQDNFDDSCNLIRVDKGCELRGISAIIGYIAMNSPHAIAVTDMYKNYDKSKKW